MSCTSTHEGEVQDVDFHVAAQVAAAKSYTIQATVEYGAKDSSREDNTG